MRIKHGYTIKGFQTNKGKEDSTHQSTAFPIIDPFLNKLEKITSIY